MQHSRGVDLRSCGRAVHAPPFSATIPPHAVSSGHGEATVPEALNELERKVLDYIVDYLRSNTYQPSIREIGREFAIRSTKTVSELLQSLANKGWIERDPSRSRGVRVLGLERHPGTASLPVVQSNLDSGAGYFEIDRRFVGSANAFLIAMTGSHLEDAGIRPGDLLLVESVSEDELEVGDIVVAEVAEVPQVRRVSATTPRIALESAGPAGAAITLPRSPGPSPVRGRISGVVRRLRPVAAHEAAQANALAH
jgi:repressor LexA